MASILNTDLGDLYTQWGERVAFNEGFQAQKIVEAKAAGRDAFHLGIDRAQGRDMYLAAKDQRFSEAREFLNPEPQQIDDSRTDDISDVELEPVEVDPIGEVTDGEETLGMESVVANETEDVRATDEDYWTYGNDPEFVQDPDGYMQSISDSNTERYEGFETEVYADGSVHPVWDSSGFMVEKY